MRLTKKEEALVQQLANTLGRSFEFALNRVKEGMAAMDERKLREAKGLTSQQKSTTHTAITVKRVG